MEATSKAQSRPMTFVEILIPTWRLVVLSISLCVGLFLSILDTSIVATALYTIGIEFGSLQSVTWVALAYTLSYVGCAVVFARLGDIYGRRNAFVAANIIFLACSVGCGFCQSLHQLIACRVVQGIGGSGLYALALIILPEICPLRKRKFIATLGGLVVAISGVLGPVLGGIITRYATWRWIFWINLPIGILPLIMFCIAWPKANQMRHARRRPLRELDFIGSVLLTAASVLVAFSFQEGGIVANAWSTALFIVPITLGCICWVLFFCWEIYITRLKGDAIATMFPPCLLKRRVFVAGALSSLLTGFPYLVVIYSLPLYFQVVYGKSSLGAGLGLLPMLGAAAVSTMLGGLLNGKKDRTFATIFAGSCLMLLGTGLLSTLTTHPKHEKRAYGFQVFIGMGFGFTVSTVSQLAVFESKRRDHSVAQGIIAQVRILGGSLGIAASTAILNTTQRRELAGIVPAAKLASLEASTATLTPEQLQAVRQATADAFDQTLRVCAAIAGIGVLITLGIFKRNPVDLAVRRQELLMEAIRDQQKSDGAAVSHESRV